MMAILLVRMLIERNFSSIKNRIHSLRCTAAITLCADLKSANLALVMLLNDLYMAAVNRYIHFL